VVYGVTSSSDHRLQLVERFRKPDNERTSPSAEIRKSTYPHHASTRQRIGAFSKTHALALRLPPSTVLTLAKGLLRRSSYNWGHNLIHKGPPRPSRHPTALSCYMERRPAALVATVEDATILEFELHYTMESFVCQAKASGAVRRRESNSPPQSL
jgi:hypothetical protein